MAIDPLTVLRARGEIGLALGGLGWQPDDLEMLIDAEFLIPSATGDRAWLSLVHRDLTGARRHLGELETLLTTALQRWREAPGRWDPSGPHLSGSCAACGASCAGMAC